MSDLTSPPKSPALPWRGGAADDAAARGTERLVRETWRHYYVAQLAEAQFGPASLEACLARSRALESYRELRSSLRDLDPYYRGKSSASRVSTTTPRHLTLVKDEPPASAEA